MSAHFAPFRVGNVAYSEWPPAGALGRALPRCGAKGRVFFLAVPRPLAYLVYHRTLLSFFEYTGCAALPSVLVLLASSVIPTLMEERSLQCCSENEEEYTAGVDTAASFI